MTCRDGVIKAQMRPRTVRTSIVGYSTELLHGFCPSLFSHRVERPHWTLHQLTRRRCTTFRFLSADSPRCRVHVWLNVRLHALSSRFSVGPALGLPLIGTLTASARN